MNDPKVQAAYMRKYRVRKGQVLRDKQAAWGRKYREFNREKITAAAKKKVARVAEIKHIRGCMVCDESDARCLDFHHRDPEHKIDNVSHLAYSATWDKVLAEIEKCDVLCSNCHRKIRIDE